MSDPTADSHDLSGRLRDGEPAALGWLFELYRPRLRQMVRLRLDGRVAARLDASDVVQETFLDAARRVGEYVRSPRVGFYVWLRGLAWQRLLKLHRTHLTAGRRAAVRDCPLPDDSADRLAGRLCARDDTPGHAAARAEGRRRVRRALDLLGPDDREVILLRDFEGLTNAEVAEALGLTPPGATMRYGRALYRLKELLRADGPPGGEGPP
jgi:RNA polymerase sigma-70 factor, ECF subfamily